MPPVGFEPTIPASAGPQIYALDGAATGIGLKGYTEGYEATWIGVVINLWHHTVHVYFWINKLRHLLQN
jgi:hypothetical protein